MFKKKLVLFLFLGVVVLAIGVRFWGLNKVPASLYYDEIDLGYQVRSFLETGKDYRGNASPFFFRSFNTDKTPLPIFFSTVPSLLFSSPEYQVRAGAVVAGVVVVLLAMVLACQLTKRKEMGLMVGLVFTLSPWQIQFSRIAFEAIFMLMIFLATLTAFLYWRNSKKIWAFYLSAVFLGLNVYTYRTMSLFAPILTVVLLLLFFRDFLKVGVVKTGIWLLIVGGLIWPFIYTTTIASADQPRINQISIFANADAPIMVMRHREVDSGDYINPEIGKKPILSSYVFHNKGVSFLTSFANNYFRTFSSEFLFLSGDPQIRHTPNHTGVLLMIDVVGLISGLVFVCRNLKDKKYQLILALLFLAPIPANLTMDGANHASRLMILAGPLLLIVGLGYANLILFLWKKRIYRFGMPVLVGTWLVMVVFYLHQYFVHFPIESARQFGYGYKQMVEKLLSIKDQYSKVKITENVDPPMLYYFFWANIEPSEVQVYGTEYGQEIVKNHPLDMIRPYYWDGKVCEVDEIEKLEPEVLYVVPFNRLSLDFRSSDKDKVPQGIKLIDMVKYPDNEVAFYFVTRETRNGLPVEPDKKDLCK